ncbi:PilW family protein [Undibacterium sp. SXout20W]|uniref:PilW family protein n=1 Tax=Undibacterium sp. SXout20W TaxID=3413051 RepID=UPI003BF2F9D0
MKMPTKGKLSPLFANQGKFRQTGFTLVELMIAITVTLVLVAGIVGMIAGLTRSFSTQDALTQIQENERFAISVLDSTIRNTGYFPGAENFTTPAGVTFTEPSGGQLKAFPATTTANPDGTTFAAGQVIVGTTTAGSDTINVRVISNPNSTVTNCQGDVNTSGSAVIWTSSLTVNASNQLICTVSVNGGAPGAQTILADNISSMKITYGLQTQTPTCLSARQAPPLNVDAYIDASGLNAPQAPQSCWLLGAVTPINWMYVMSAQIKLTFVNTVVPKSGGTTPTLTPILHTIYMMNVT